MTRLALITGGTSGIGFGIAEALAGSFDLALAYASQKDRAESAARRIREEHPGRRVEIFQACLATADDCRSLVSDVERTLGTGPDILINSAGKVRDGVYMSTEFSLHQDMLMEHLLVPMALSHLCVNKMYKQKFGRIVNLSSITARRAKRGQVSYTSVKAGIEGFTRGLALEVAHRGVTVNAIAPGLIKTPMTEALIEKIEADLGLRQVIPAGYAGEPRDVAGAVAFLCGDGGRYITGQTIDVDGGRGLGEI